jgi:preprotein translocase subunit SecB
MMAEQNKTEKQITIQKIYLKDFSFESPNSPTIFTSSDGWNPKTNLNLRSTHTKCDDDQSEIVLTVTIEAKQEDKTLFLVELAQAGLFLLSGYSKEELDAIVSSFCPNILFPYARESVSAIITKGGFPEFLLQPINFDALYAQSRNQAETDSNNGGTH